MSDHEPTLSAETVPVNPELSFAEEVQSYYEELVPEGTGFSWNNRAERFVREGVDNLWRQYNAASTAEKIVYGGLVAAGAYVGFRILRAAVEGVFNLGTWMLDSVSNIREDSLGLILKLTLGATVIGLIPLLYLGISRGRLSLPDIFAAWDEDGFEGLLALLASEFPEGVQAMSNDVKSFIRETIGAERFDAWFEGVSLMPTPGGEEVLPPNTELEDEPAAVPTDLDTQPEEVTVTPEVVFTPTGLTAERLDEFLLAPGIENFTLLINSLIENEGGMVVEEGRILLVDEVGELFDLSRWLTFQYGDAIADVVAAGEADPEAQIGAYVLQYLKESPKFMVLASSLEFINLLRGRHASLFLRPVMSGLTWGAWPLRLVGAAARHVGGTAAFARFTRDGVVFLSRAGVNLARLTPQGAVLMWEGGRFVSREIARQTARLGFTRALGAAIGQTYTRTVGRQVTHFTSRTFTNRLLGVAGWRGATTAALWANDATVIGVLDDVLAVALTAWLAADVYKLIQVTRSTLEFQRLMTEQENLAIVEIVGLDEATQSRLAELNTEEEMEEASAFEFLSSLPRAEFKVLRENGVHETYRMVRGQILSVEIYEGPTLLADFTEEDIETLSQELPPPNNFDRWEIDYEEEDETLFAHYRLAFTYVLNETGWGALDYDIKDNRTLEVKRRDSQQAVFLHREGENWFIGADRDTSFDLFQAISMANLINRVESILLSEIRMPSGDTPFYSEADGLHISRPGFDTTILEGEEDSWYQQFYRGQLGLNPDIITQSLNRHYQDSTRPQLQNNLDEYMQDFIPG
jgi:hypothetical protein